MFFWGGFFWVSLVLGLWAYLLRGLKPTDPYLSIYYVKCADGHMIISRLLTGLLFPYLKVNMHITYFIVKQCRKEIICKPRIVPWVYSLIAFFQFFSILEIKNCVFI